MKALARERPAEALAVPRSAGPGGALPPVSGRSKEGAPTGKFEKRPARVERLIGRAQPAASVEPQALRARGGAPRPATKAP